MKDKKLSSQDVAPIELPPKKSPTVEEPGLARVAAPSGARTDLHDTTASAQTFTGGAHITTSRASLGRGGMEAGAGYSLLLCGSRFFSCDPSIGVCTSDYAAGCHADMSFLNFTCRPELSTSCFINLAVCVYDSICKTCECLVKTTDRAIDCMSDPIRSCLPGPAARSMV